MGDFRSNEKSKVAHSFYMGYDQDFGKKNYRDTDVNIVKWFPDGTSFVAGCDGGTVRLFDIRSARMLNEYSYHANYLNVKTKQVEQQMIVNAEENETVNDEEEEEEEEEDEDEEDEGGLIDEVHTSSTAKQAVANTPM